MDAIGRIKASAHHMVPIGYETGGYDRLHIFFRQIRLPTVE